MVVVVTPLGPCLGLRERRGLSIRIIVTAPYGEVPVVGLPKLSYVIDNCSPFWPVCEAMPSHVL